MSSGTYYYFIKPSKSKLACIQLQIHVEARTAIRGLPRHGGKITPTSERHVDVNEEKTDDNRCRNKPARWRHGINAIDHAILQQIQQHTTWTFSSSLRYKKNLYLYTAKIFKENATFIHNSFIRLLPYANLLICDSLHMVARPCAVFDCGNSFCCLLQEQELNSHGGHSQLQLHTPGTSYHLTRDHVTVYTPLKTPQNTPV